MSIKQSSYYCITITPTSRKPYSKVAFERSLDRYEEKYKIFIIDRCYEIGPKTGKLHVHALIRCEFNGTTPFFLFKGQKNHNIHCEPCLNLAAWREYSHKDQKKKLPRLV